MSEIFESKQQENPVSEGEESKGTDLPKKKIEGTPEYEQSIKDKVLKEVAEREKVWKQEQEEMYQNLKQLQETVKALQTPKQENVIPQMPQKPADFNPVDVYTDPESRSAKYWAEYQDYLEKKDRYQTGLLLGLQEKIQQEERLKQMQQQAELTKAKTLAAFQKQGLEPQEAMELYNKLDTALKSPIDEGAELFAKMFKAEKPNPKADGFDKRKDKRDAILPPGIDGGGGIPADDETKSFMDGIGGTKKQGLFQTK